jgi:predicted RNA binding protein YcfA (HicA-like mRNA interferase family)
MMTGRDLIRLLERNGWRIDRIRGSHHVLKKEGEHVVVPVHGSKDLKIGTLRDIMKKAELD